MNRTDEVKAILFGPLFWGQVASKAVRATRTFRAAEDPNRADPEDSALRSADTAQHAAARVAPTLRADARTRRAILLGGMLWGVLTYCVLCAASFLELVNYVGDQAVPAGIGALRLTEPSADNAKIASRILSEAGAKDDKNLIDTLGAALGNIFSQPNTSHRLDQVGALRLAQLVAASSYERKCDIKNGRPDTCPKMYRHALARLLIGGASSCTNQDLRALRGEAPIQGCAMVPIFSREDPMPASEVAELLGCSVQTCPLVTNLLQGAIDEKGARIRATFGIGIVYGKGRLVVFVLFCCLLGTLLHRFTAQLTQIAHVAHINMAVKQSRAEPQTKASLVTLVENDFVRKFVGDAGDATPLAEHSEYANPRVHPIASLLEAATRSYETKDDTLVADAAKLARSEVDSWRETLNAWITLFPVIGFSATLLGLIMAFAGADRIAVAAGSERALAIRGMVGELSSCFATTFLALLAMAILTLISLNQHHREQHMIDTLAEHLENMLAWRR